MLKHNLKNQLKPHNEVQNILINFLNLYNWDLEHFVKCIKRLNANRIGMQALKESFFLCQFILNRLLFKLISQYFELILSYLHNELLFGANCLKH
jgi:hypothetical protein